MIWWMEKMILLTVRRSRRLIFLWKWRRVLNPVETVWVMLLVKCKKEQLSCRGTQKRVMCLKV